MAIFVTKKEDIEAFENYTTASISVDEFNETSNSAHKSKQATSIDLDFSSTHENVINQVNKISNNNSETDRIKASPLAKKIANEKGINLNEIEMKPGSGPNGRIIKNDILSLNTVKDKSSYTSGLYIDLPLSNVRKVIANRLTDSKQSIPHYYLKVEIEMDKILEIRSKFNSNPLLQESFGPFKLSVNDFIIKATALALKKVPECNSAWQGDYIRQYERADICVAVATPNGLITPIISDADSKGLVEISGLLKELAGRAKINKLKPIEYQVN